MSKERIGPDWDRVERTIGKEGRETLSQKEVVIVGVGSLGSEITRLLSMTGVENLGLIDPDWLEATNAPRHWAGLNYLGEFKVAAVRDLIIKEKNPEAKVWAVVGDAQLQPEFISKFDLAIITGLGSNHSQAYIAEILRARGIPTEVAQVYEKGKGGEVFFINPNEGPCYSCFSSFLSRKVNKEVRERPTVYGIEEDRVGGIPALAIDIDRIATLASGFAVKNLLGKGMDENSPVNLIIFANQHMELGKTGDGKTVYLESLDSRWFAIEKNPECLVCAKEQRPTGISLNELSSLLEGGE